MKATWSYSPNARARWAELRDSEGLETCAVESIVPTSNINFNGDNKEELCTSCCPKRHKIHTVQTWERRQEKEVIGDCCTFTLLEWCRRKKQIAKCCSVAHVDVKSLGVVQRAGIFVLYFQLKQRLSASTSFCTALRCTIYTHFERTSIFRLDP
jgi:hypothetical protein